MPLRRFRDFFEELAHGKLAVAGQARAARDVEHRRMYLGARRRGTDTSHPIGERVASIEIHERAESLLGAHELVRVVRKVALESEACPLPR